MANRKVIIDSANSKVFLGQHAQKNVLLEEVYGNTGSGAFYYAYPRIEVVDGTEMSFQELLKGPNYKELALKI